MKKVMAWEKLNNLEYSSRLSMADFYNLLLEAGYNEEAAKKAANKRGWDRLDAGVMM